MSLAHEPPRSVLILRLSSLGDVINSLPTLVAVRRSFPEARIGWVVADRFAEAIEGHPCIDDLFVMPTKRGRKARGADIGVWASSREMWAFVKALRARRYEVSLDLQGRLRGAVIARVAGCRTRVVIEELTRGHGRRYGNVVVKRLRGPAAYGYLAAAAAIGVDISQAEYDFYIPEADGLWADEALGTATSPPDPLSTGGEGEREMATASYPPAPLPRREGGTATADNCLPPTAVPLIALNPGASKPWKQWASASFVMVARALNEEFGARIVILGGPGDSRVAGEIEAGLDGQALNLCGKCTIKRLGAVLRRCSLAISSDTGPLHLAAAVHTPTVALFSSSNPSDTAPWSDSNTVVQARGRDCIPCADRPTCEEPTCAGLITPGMVLEAARERLGVGAAERSGGPPAYGVAGGRRG